MQITPYNADSSRSREGMPFPSPNSTRAGRRTRGRLRTVLWIQEISQTWCVAESQSECDYRVPSGPFYQPVSSRTGSHRNKPSKGEKSHSVCDSEERALRGATWKDRRSFLLTTSLGWKEMCSQLASSLFFLQQRLCTENFLKQTVTEGFSTGKGSGIFFLRATNQSWNGPHEIHFLVMRKRAVWQMIQQV